MYEEEMGEGGSCMQLGRSLEFCLVSILLYHEIFKRWGAIGFRMPGEPEHAPSHRKKVAMIDLTKPLSANHRVICALVSGHLPPYRLNFVNKVGTGTPHDGRYELLRCPQKSSPNAQRNGPKCPPYRAIHTFEYALFIAIGVLHIHLQPIHPFTRALPYFFPTSSYLALILSRHSLQFLHLEQPL